MRSARFTLCVAAFSLACLYPLVADPYWLTVGILALFYAIATSSWALLVGYAGQFSFGHMGFVSVGAYCAALLMVSFGVPLPIGMVAALVLAGLLGAVIGFTCLRMHGPYLAIFTMAFSEVFRIVVLTENEVTGGAGGLEVPALFHTRSDAPYFYLGLGLLAAALGVMALMTTSRWGLFFRAIRENEQAAAAAGVKVVRFRVLVFAIASAIAGLAGAFYAPFIGILTPDLGSVDQMGLIVAMAVIGGTESLTASVIGAIIVEFLIEALRAYGQWRLVLFGALLLLTVRFARNGLLAPVWDKMLRFAPMRRPQPAE